MSGVNKLRAWRLLGLAVAVGGALMLAIGIVGVLAGNTAAKIVYSAWIVGVLPLNAWMTIRWWRFRAWAHSQTPAEH